MARIAIRPRPPILAAMCLAALAVMLGPHPVVSTDPEPLGPRPKCIVAGEPRGDLYIPEGHWSMPTATPRLHSNMPILRSDSPIIDVDTLVSGLKSLLATPKT